MPDCFHELIRDTLSYLKDPLCPKQSMLTSAENFIFFQKQKLTVSEQHLSSREKEAVPLKTDSSLPLPSPRPMQTIISENNVSATRVLEKVAKPRFEDKSPLLAQDSASVQKSSDLAPNQSFATPSPIKKMLQKIAPNLKLIDQIPDDGEAKRIASGWKEKIADAEVVLLVCDTRAETLEFLKGLAKAIDQHLGKTKILMAERLEREKRWEIFFDKNSFRLLIASDGIQTLPELMRFYKSVPAHAQLFLATTPLLALSPFSVYKSLEHKALLWKTLCQMLKK